MHLFNYKHEVNGLWKPTCIRGGGGSEDTGGCWSPTIEGVGIICVTCTTCGSPRPLGGTAMGAEDGICKGPGPMETDRGTDAGMPVGIPLPELNYYKNH